MLILTFLVLVRLRSLLICLFLLNTRFGLIYFTYFVYLFLFIFSFPFLIILVRNVFSVCISRESLLSWDLLLLTAASFLYIPGYVCCDFVFCDINFQDIFLKHCAVRVFTMYYLKMMICVRSYIVSMVLNLLLCILFLYYLLILYLIGILHCSVKTCRLSNNRSFLCI